MRALFLLFILTYTISAKAQPNYPPPSGVYCSCGPTTGQGYGSVNPLVAAKPFVKGILVRIGWNLLEPTDNNYNWQLLDDQISRAQQYGKKVSLGIPSGILIPQWVFDSGAQRLVSSLPFNDTIAVPWDTTYLNKWTEFIGELGKRYQNDTTIQLVYLSHSTANGMEMQLPRATTPTLAAVGYTDAKMISSWKHIVDAFNSAFPNHYLSNDFHPVESSNVVADSVYVYARATIGSRYGAAAWWWTQHNAANVYPAQYNIIKHSVGNNSFTSVQFANSGTADSAKFGAGGMPGAMQLAINDGICYWEVWNEDILNPKFDSLLSSVNCNSLSVTSIDKRELSIYPNPNNGVFTINIPTNKQAEIMITDINGRVLYKEQVANKEKYTINISNKPNGIYMLQLTTAEGIYHTKVLVQ